MDMKRMQIFLRNHHIRQEINCTNASILMIWGARESAKSTFKLCSKKVDKRRGVLVVEKWYG
jgi:hypothetical protein